MVCTVQHYLKRHHAFKRSAMTLACPIREKICICKRDRVTSSYWLEFNSSQNAVKELPAQPSSDLEAVVVEPKLAVLALVPALAKKYLLFPAVQVAPIKDGTCTDVHPPLFCLQHKLDPN